MTQDITGNGAPLHDGESRRDFLVISAGAFAAVGTAAALWPFVDSMNPTADVKALAAIEVDLAPMQVGQRITVKWRGRPVFLVRRSPEMIASAQKDDGNQDLIDPAPDSARAQRAEWLVVIGICTHLGCIPQGQKTADLRGKYGGWFCSCHGSVYDLAGRVRRGPAPRNLDLPPYTFLTDTRLRIG